ncbi:hypothetical protein GX441_06600 [bacterium]|nr:hypothetical protein [bacterium]
MKNKITIKLLTLCLLALAVAPAMKAEYYEPDLFPIGLSGLGTTGNHSIPYGNVGMTWGDEYSLIRDLKVNCIGIEDGFAGYLIDMYPETPTSTHPYESNYLHQVCTPSFSDAPNNPDIDSIFIIPLGLYVEKIYCHGQKKYKGDDLDDWIWPWHQTEGYEPRYDHKEWEGNPDNWNEKVSTMFRPWNYSGASGCGFGPDEFKRISGTSTDPNNYSYFGDPSFHKVIDNAIIDMNSHFNNNSDHYKYIWGWNLMTEDPLSYAGEVGFHVNAKPTVGAWGAVNRMFLGKNAAGATNLNPDHNGVRGMEDTCTGWDGKNRMIVGKGGLWPLAMIDVNIFEGVPDLDAFIEYYEGWALAKLNYGDQGIFDNMLYGTLSIAPDREKRKLGIQNAAIYMQKYGNTPPLREGQKRRWFMGIGTAWRGLDVNYTHVIDNGARRPCPPEFRCAIYIALSRGAKGIFFIRWLSTPETNKYPEVQIPNAEGNGGSLEVGMRDCQGWPFGLGPASDPNYVTNHHFLNSGRPSSDPLYTYWHSPTGRIDQTYTYLRDELIPEIKAIDTTLMQLDWVNGYSLNSTDPNWASPCPHEYVTDVWGVDYMDLALFDHPYEPIGVEYFMLVNREGIADMTNRTVSVALDAGHWPQEDSLTLTDIAHKDSPQTLVREGGRYVFTQVFEPGEGKLYRVAPANAAPVAINDNRP